MNDALTVSSLHVSYHGNEAIKDINFSIEKGKLVGIIGPNGAGKSTLLKSLLGLIPIDKGNVKIFGENVDKVRKGISYVPQRNDIDWDFPITVLDAVLIGTYPKLGLFNRPKKKERIKAYECLQKVGMADFAKRQIGELSGGQQQRVFLARALAQESEIFFLDEPFVGVDISSENTIINVLKELRNEGKTVFVVHHDLSKAENYFDQLILINKELIEFGDVHQVFRPEVMVKAYKEQLSFLEEVGVSV
ncbi:metal ABC transporter ATP-binding protein [Salirhabdus salicampi]|uniref:metal ABC transporter ATP-binding protein n=1 Tax=Salirhabdus salicampi TaxID=476102 RepID=UPI0020C58257|nr:metal ABC transporter ATP-binding protein [Salirhabdus salicampi]MCP8615466.1 metal ABC transporter ATP-binding protein [Salirhabdus salicampi]